MTRRRSTFAGRCWNVVGLTLVIAAVVCAIGIVSTHLAAAWDGR